MEDQAALPQPALRRGRPKGHRPAARTACGLYGKAVPQQMISDTAKQIFSRIGIRYDDWEFQVDGQISMEALKDGN